VQRITASLFEPGGPLAFQERRAVLTSDGYSAAMNPIDRARASMSVAMKSPVVFLLS